MIHVAQHRAKGPTAGTRYLRPEIQGAHRWKVFIRTTQAVPDGVVRNERQITVDTPTTLGMIRDIAIQEINEITDAPDIVDYTLDFFVPGKRAKSRR